MPDTSGMPTTHAPAPTLTDWLETDFDLPLGTVLTDGAGIQIIYYGTVQTRQGPQMRFIPRAEYTDANLPVAIAPTADAIHAWPQLKPFSKPGAAGPATDLPPVAVDLDRLEHVIDLPLGTVIPDNAGVVHVYIGRTRNTAGAMLNFIPKAGSYRNAMTSRYALVSGGFQKFPGLRAFIKAGITLP